MENTHAALVEELVRDGYLKTPRIVEAFHAVRRAPFVPKEAAQSAYVNEPAPIGFGQTISQPLTVAFMMELLQPLPAHKVLDVGFGSGWTTALLSHIVGENGKVYAMEIRSELFEFGKRNVERFGARNVEFHLGSGWDGLSYAAPFDRILVSAAASEVPAALRRQLAPKGVMVIPVGAPSAPQRILKIMREEDGTYKEEEYPGFAFVPLVKE